MANQASGPFPRIVIASALALCACDGASVDGPDDPPVTPNLPPYTEVEARFDPSQTFVADRTPPAMSGGTLAVSKAGVVVAADPDRDQLYVVDVAKGELDTVRLRELDEPGRVISDEQHAFVALRGAGAVVRVDLATLAVSRFEACTAPRGLAFTRDGEGVLVACANGELVTLARDGAQLARVYVEDDLRDVGTDASGIWLTRYRGAELLRIDAEGHVQRRERPGALSIVDVGFEASEFTPTLAARTITDAEGHPLMLHQRAQSTTVRVDFGGYGGNQLCESGIVHTTLTKFEGDEVAAALPIVPSSVVPLDVAVSPSGERIAIVSPGGLSQQHAVRESNGFEVGPGGSLGPARQLSLLSATQLEPMPPEVLPCHVDAPQYEHLFPGEATSVAFVDEQRFVVLVREPAQLHVFDVDASGSARLTRVVALSTKSVLDTGHQLFHQSAGLGLACASCHGEGHDDQHVWTFDGVGPRRTQSLLGGVLGSEPFHWDGDIADFDTLVDVVFVTRMGGDELPGAWKKALAGFVDDLPAVPYAAPVASDAVERGRELFEASDCSSCHGGATYRSPGSFDVGTGGTFQVPSLLGVSERLPLMHDGCAATLEQRFDPSCGGTKHGATDLLTDAQRADLIAFLSSL